MKFRIPKSSPLYQIFCAWFWQFAEATDEALNYAKSQGAVAPAITTNGHFMAFEFESPTPIDGWRRFSPKQDRCIHIPRKGKNTRDIFAAMDKINEKFPAQKSLNDTIGFEPQASGNVWMQGFGITVTEDEILITMNELAKYTPPPDIEEITVSRYNELAGPDGCNAKTFKVGKVTLN